MLEDGIVDVGVPVQNGAVQIGARGATERSRLVVANDAASVAIYRIDRIPLQVEMNDTRFQSNGELTMARINLFRSPVESVTIQREIGGRAWQLSRCADVVTSEPAFWNFIDTTLSYAKKKQLENSFRHK